MQVGRPAALAPVHEDSEVVIDSSLCPSGLSGAMGPGAVSGVSVILGDLG